MLPGAARGKGNHRPMLAWKNGEAGDEGSLQREDLGRKWHGYGCEDRGRTGTRGRALLAVEQAQAAYYCRTVFWRHLPSSSGSGQSVPPRMLPVPTPCSAWHTTQEWEPHTKASRLQCGCQSQTTVQPSHQQRQEYEEEGVGFLQKELYLVHFAHFQALEVLHGEMGRQHEPAQHDETNRQSSE